MYFHSDSDFGNSRYRTCCDRDSCYECVPRVHLDVEGGQSKVEVSVLSRTTEELDWSPILARKIVSRKAGQKEEQEE